MGQHLKEKDVAALEIAPLIFDRVDELQCLFECRDRFAREACCAGANTGRATNPALKPTAIEPKTSFAPSMAKVICWLACASVLSVTMMRGMYVPWPPISAPLIMPLPASIERPSGSGG